MWSSKQDSVRVPTTPYYRTKVLQARIQEQRSAGVYHTSVGKAKCPTYTNLLLWLHWQSTT